MNDQPRIRVGGARAALPALALFSIGIPLALAAVANPLPLLEGDACWRGHADTDAGDVDRAACLIVLDGCADGRVSLVTSGSARLQGVRYCNAWLTGMM